MSANINIHKIFLSIILVFVIESLWAQDICKVNAYDLEAHGRIIHPVELPSGVYFTDNYSSAIYKLSDNNINKVLVAENCGLFNSFSEDGKKIAFKKFSPSGKQAPAILNLSSNNVEILHPFTMQCGQPVFYDKGKIAFTIADTLFLQKAKYVLGVYSNIIAISPDSKIVAYSDSNQQMFIYNMATQSSKQISCNSTSFLYPQWSPDGEKLSYSSIDGRLFIYSLLQDTTIELAYGGNLKWFSNSNFVLFERSHLKEFQSSTSDLYISDWKGKNISVLSNNINIDECQASIISGSEIIFANQSKLEIYKAEIDFSSFSLVNLRLIYSQSQALDISFYDTKKFANTRSIVDIGFIPYVHQVYDTPDFHDGSGSCGPTTAVMNIAYYNILPPWPTEVNKLYTHWNSYGSYVADRYHYNEFYYDTYTSPYGSDSWGAYSFMWSTASPSSTLKNYYQQHGFDANQSWTYNCSFDDTKAEIDSGFPHTICHYMTTAGHITLAKGYIEGQHTLMFHDPFGDKNTAGYPSYDGQNVFYDWPGYNNGFQNLDPDGSHGGVAWTVTSHLTHPVYNDTIINDQSFGHGFYMFNKLPSHQGYYRDQLDGYGGHSWWTSTINSINDVCYVTWQPTLPDSGLYEVAAFIPANYSNANSSYYRIHYSGIDTTVIINQSAYSDEWVLLGYFNLNPNDSCSVYLGDNTGIYGEYMAFDAMRFSREFLVGIKENYKVHEKLKVYPNPANDMFTVSMPHSNSESRRLIINTINAKIVKIINVPPGINEYSLSAKSLHLSQGNYLIRLESSSQIFKQRLSIIE